MVADADNLFSAIFQDKTFKMLNDNPVSFTVINSGLKHSGIAMICSDSV